MGELESKQGLEGPLSLRPVGWSEALWTAGMDLFLGAVERSTCSPRRRVSQGTLRR